MSDRENVTEALIVEILEEVLGSPATSAADADTPPGSICDTGNPEFGKVLVSNEVLSDAPEKLTTELKGIIERFVRHGKSVRFSIGRSDGELEYEILPD